MHPFMPLMITAIMGVLLAGFTILMARRERRLRRAGRRSTG
jgi:hypothetical protein